MGADFHKLTTPNSSLVAMDWTCAVCTLQNAAYAASCLAYVCVHATCCHCREWLTARRSCEAPRPGGEADRGDGAIARAGWECEQCTFVNTSAGHECVMCGFSNAPVEPVPEAVWQASSRLSQYSVPDGRSACTAIAVEACIYVLAPTLTGTCARAAPGLLRWLITRAAAECEARLDAVVTEGAAKYASLGLTGGGVEHTSVSEVLALLPALGERLEVLEEGVQGRTTAPDAFRDVLSAAQARALPDAPVCVLITKYVRACQRRAVAPPPLTWLLAGRRRLWRRACPSPAPTAPPASISSLTPTRAPSRASMCAADARRGCCPLLAAHAPPPVPQGAHVLCFRTLQDLCAYLRHIFPGMDMEGESGSRSLCTRRGSHSDGPRAVYADELYNTYEVTAVRVHGAPAGSVGTESAEARPECAGAEVAPPAADAGEADARASQPSAPVDLATALPAEGDAAAPADAAAAAPR